MSDPHRPDPSANATTHGLTAKRPLCEEEMQRMQVICAQWTSKAMPETPPEEALIASAAIEYVRYLRCVEAEEARLKPASKDALREWKEQKQHAIRKRAQSLPLDPSTVAAELHESAFGIDWMLRHWRNLLALIVTGRGWSGDNLIQALHLLGHEATRPADVNSEAFLVWMQSATAFPKARDLAAPAVGDLGAVEAIKGLVEDRIARLEILRPIVWEDVEAPQAGAVEVAAMVDTSKDGQLRQRYRREAFRDFHRSLGQLSKLRVERSKMHARESRTMREASSNRHEAPAYVSPAARPAPEYRNEPPKPAEPDSGGRHNSFSENQIRNTSPEPSPSFDGRTPGRTEGRTEADRDPRHAPDATIGRPQAAPGRPSDGPDRR